MTHNRPPYCIDIISSTCHYRYFLVTFGRSTLSLVDKDTMQQSHVDLGSDDVRDENFEDRQDDADRLFSKPKTWILAGIVLLLIAGIISFGIVGWKRNWFVRNNNVNAPTPTPQPIQNGGQPHNPNLQANPGKPPANPGKPQFDFSVPKECTISPPTTSKDPNKQFSALQVSQWKSKGKLGNGKPSGFAFVAILHYDVPHKKLRVAMHSRASNTNPQPFLGLPGGWVDHAGESLAQGARMFMTVTHTHMHQRIQLYCFCLIYAQTVKQWKKLLLDVSFL